MSHFGIRACWTYDLQLLKSPPTRLVEPGQCSDWARTGNSGPSAVLTQSAASWVRKSLMKGCYTNPQWHSVPSASVTPDDIWFTLECSRTKSEPVMRCAAVSWAWWWWWEASHQTTYCRFPQEMLDFYFGIILQNEQQCQCQWKKCQTAMGWSRHPCLGHYPNGSCTPSWGKVKQANHSGEYHITTNISKNTATTTTIIKWIRAGRATWLHYFCDISVYVTCVSADSWYKCDTTAPPSGGCAWVQCATPWPSAGPGQWKEDISISKGCTRKLGVKHKDDRQVHSSWHGSFSLSYLDDVHTADTNNLDLMGSQMWTEQKPKAHTPNLLLWNPEFLFLMEFTSIYLWQ